MLDLEERDGVAVIHLHGHGHNRLDTALLRRLAAAMEFVGASRPVVLTGNRATFAVGAEVTASPSAEDAALSRLVECAEPSRRVRELLDAQDAALTAVAEHPAPVVAAVNGDAIDTGFALAAAADVRLMERGLIGTVFAPQGVVPLSAVADELVRAALARCGAPVPSGALPSGASASGTLASGALASGTPPSDALASGALAFTAAEAEAAGFVHRPRRLPHLLYEAVQHAKAATRVTSYV